MMPSPDRLQWESPRVQEPFYEHTECGGIYSPHVALMQPDCEAGFTAAAGWLAGSAAGYGCRGSCGHCCSAGRAGSSKISTYFTRDSLKKAWNCVPN